MPRSGFVGGVQGAVMLFVSPTIVLDLDIVLINNAFDHVFSAKQS